VANLAFDEYDAQVRPVRCRIGRDHPGRAVSTFIPARTDARWHHIRLIVFLPSVIILTAALVLYFLGISGHELFLFLAGLAGGAALTEATALERRDGELEQRTLREENKSLASQVLSIREPELAAAIEVGINFATVNRSSQSNAAGLLGVSDQIRGAADADDFDAVCDVLRTKFGTAVSESFLLGRQLALLLISEDNGTQTRALVSERLALRVQDSELAAAVDGVLASRKSLPDSAKGGYVSYLGFLLRYLSGSTTTADARNLRGRLLLGISASDDAPGGGDTEEEERRVKFRQFLQQLIAAGIDKQDREVQLFWGVENDEPELVKDALKNGADTSVTDTEIMRRYRAYL
jgi:hypothetical protein